MSMARGEIRIEQLLNRTVLGVDGGAVGRIEEVCAETRAGDLVVTEYRLGSYAALKRSFASSIGIGIFRPRRRRQEYRVPWNKLDVTDPQHPRLTCIVEELRSAATEAQTES
jgi:sporulation protein YlmC with PRC-barrel domain